MKCPAILLYALFASSYVLSASIVHAQDSRFSRHCYLRNYDRAHLLKHPRQTVQRIEVDFDKGYDEEKAFGTNDAKIVGGIGFKLKSSKEWYEDNIYCKSNAHRFDCYLEADGGTIRLRPQGGALRLEVTGGGGGTDQIAVEGGKDFGMFGAPGSDDRVFVLQRAEGKACRNSL